MLNLKLNRCFICQVFDWAVSVTNKMDSVTGSRNLQRFWILDFWQIFAVVSKWLSFNDGRKTSDRSSKRIVSGGSHTTDTIRLEKRAVIHSSILLTLTPTPFNHHLCKSGLGNLKNATFISGKSKSYNCMNMTTRSGGTQCLNLEKPRIRELIST